MDAPQTPQHVTVDPNHALTLVDRLVRAIANSNTADDLCMLLVTDVLKDFQVAATYLARLDQDSRVSVVGSFGYPNTRTNPDDRPSLWEPMAITDAIRTNQIQIHPTWEHYLTQYPDLTGRAGPGQAFVCIPITIGGARAGGLGMAFVNPLTDSTFTEQLWPILANAADLFVTRQHAATNPHTATTQANTPTQPTDLSALTERSYTILQRIAQGLTNKQIAQSLAYSESTIKQETIRIFRALGVSRRDDAVNAARTLGILDSGDSPAS